MDLGQPASQTIVPVPPGHRGFIHKITEETKLGAGISLEIIQPDGQYDASLPVGESQNLGIEMWNCVANAVINSAETLIIRNFGDTKLLSKRFLSKISGTVIGEGNNISTVLQALLTHWTPLESEYPFTPGMSAQEYYMAIAIQIINEALAEYGYVFGFEAVNQGIVTIEDIKKILPYSPVITAVDGDYKLNAQGYIANPNVYDHCIMISGYTPNAVKVRDSYPPYDKLFAGDYKFLSLYAISLKKKSSMTFYKTILQCKLITQATLMQLGTDGLYYPILSGDYFKILYGDYSKNEIVTRAITDDMVAQTKQPDGTIKVRGIYLA